MHFNKTKLAEMRNAINYMLGQLQPVHNKAILMSLHEGFRKYTDKNWTVNRMALFSLYYLGVASDQLPEFRPSAISDKDFVSPINRQALLKPTLSPDDPNFRKKGGQEPADD